MEELSTSDFIGLITKRLKDIHSIAINDLEEVSTKDLIELLDKSCKDINDRDDINDLKSLSPSDLLSLGELLTLNKKAIKDVRDRAINDLEKSSRSDLLDLMPKTVKDIQEFNDTFLKGSIQELRSEGFKDNVDHDKLVNMTESLLATNTEEAVSKLTLVKNSLVYKSIESLKANEIILSTLDSYFDNTDRIFGMHQAVYEKLFFSKPNIYILEGASLKFAYLKQKRNNKRHYNLQFDKEYEFLDELEDEHRLKVLDEEILFESSVVEYHKTLLPFASQLETQSKPVQSPVKSNSSYSYNWNISDIKLEALYDALCKEHIANTSLEDFKATFSNQLIGSFKPVRWASENATELIYFITSINKLITSGRTKNNWVRLSNCFVRPDGSLFNRGNFKSLYQVIDRDLSPKKRASIDRLLLPFK